MHNLETRARQLFCTGIGQTEVAKCKSINNDIVALLKTLVDEWAAPVVKRKVGDHETVIALGNDSARGYTHPAISRYLTDEDYSELFNAIQTPEDFWIVNRFLLDKIKSKNDREKIPEFLKNFQDMSNVDEYLNFPFVNAYKKITSIERLPSQKEAIDLIVFSEENYLKDNLEDNLKLFGLDHLICHESDYPESRFTFGYFTLGGFKPNFHKHDVYHIFTDEFVDALAKEIKTYNIKGSIVEIAAGNGKLSYWLRKHKVPSIATDITKHSKYVEELSSEEALKYQPELVLTSWLLQNQKDDSSRDIQKQILNTPSVRFYISIEPRYLDTDTSAQNQTAFDKTHMTNIEALSIPSDLFKIDTDSSDYANLIQQLKKNPENILSDKKTVFLYKRK